jgi:uracil-DNA glycosylase
MGAVSQERCKPRNAASEAPGRAGRSRALTRTRGSLDALLREVRACRICEAALPLGPRPVLRGSATARILIVGQAPGTRVHATGIPWNDPSGDRLRAWMGVDRDTFYDETRIAIIPMGFCYPGRDPRGGDLPPRKECAERWLANLLAHLANREFTILAGQYAQAYYLGDRRKRSVMETVRAWREYFPEYLPLPHPSPRNTLLLRNNPWFGKEIVPALRARVRGLLGEPS